MPNFRVAAGDLKEALVDKGREVAAVAALGVGATTLGACLPHPVFMGSPEGSPSKTVLTVGDSTLFEQEHGIGNGLDQHNQYHYLTDLEKNANFAPYISALHGANVMDLQYVKTPMQLFGVETDILNIQLGYNYGAIDPQTGQPGYAFDVSKQEVKKYVDKVRPKCLFFTRINSDAWNNPHSGEPWNNVLDELSEELAQRTITVSGKNINLQVVDNSWDEEIAANPTHLRDGAHSSSTGVIAQRLNTMQGIQACSVAIDQALADPSITTTTQETTTSTEPETTTTTSEGTTTTTEPEPTTTSTLPESTTTTEPLPEETTTTTEPEPETTTTTEVTP